MANKTLFKTAPGRVAPKTDAVNLAGGRAYSLAAEHALAQLAATGCMNATYYAGAETQLETILDLAMKVSPEFLAKTAMWSRREGDMKDMPALLCAVLAGRDGDLLEKVFHGVIDNGKMLRGFVQIVRSGVAGRKSFGTRPRRLIREWFDKRTDRAVFTSSVGADPSLVDIIKMVHPKGATPSRNSLYAYLIGKEHDATILDSLVKEWEAFKSDASASVPDVPFEMLTALELSPAHWRELAMNAPWHRARMNLNTFARHGLMDDKVVVKALAARLADPSEVAKSKVFPYQLLMAYTATGGGAVPIAIREALQDALDHSLSNVPELPGQTYVFPDISGSMKSPVTGTRKGSTSAVQCIDVAALIASAVLRRNKMAEVLPFADTVRSVELNPRDSVMTNAAKISNLPNGGTDCSAPLALLNARKAQGDLIIYVSDNESWIDSGGRTRGLWRTDPTGTMAQWEVFRARNPQAKMVCIDLSPNTTTQAIERNDILNIGGFSDKVFDVIALFARGELGPDHWTGLIQKTEI